MNFEMCACCFLHGRTLGLTEDEGVVIPSTNVKHLMLRRNVVSWLVALTFQALDKPYPAPTKVEAASHQWQMNSSRFAEKLKDGNGLLPGTNGKVTVFLSDEKRRT